MSQSEHAVVSKKQKQTQIALIGGIERLKNHYTSEAEKLSIHLRIFNTSKANREAKLHSFDAVVIFTNQVSHRAKGEVMAISKSCNIPVLMSHSCGVCSLRNCINCLKDKQS